MKTSIVTPFVLLLTTAVLAQTPTPPCDPMTSNCTVRGARLFVAQQAPATIAAVDAEEAPMVGQCVKDEAVPLEARKLAAAHLKPDLRGAGRAELIVESVGGVVRDRSSIPGYLDPEPRNAKL